MPLYELLLYSLTTAGEGWMVWDDRWRVVGVSVGQVRGGKVGRCGGSGGSGQPGIAQLTRLQRQGEAVVAVHCTWYKKLIN